MTPPSVRDQAGAAAAYVRERTKHRPVVAVILGSGLGHIADLARNADLIPFEDIPHFPVSTVAGHAGRLVIGEIGKTAVLLMQGRIHFYEGYSPAQVTFPVRLMSALGVKAVVITNAAGGLNATFAVGDLMLITDHVNLPGLVGANPLMGPNDPLLGPRFPDMMRAYAPEFLEIARKAARREDMLLREGVYVHVSGPNYETPAELRFLRMMGDAVGMSTAPEVVAAAHAGLRVLGVTCVTDMATGEDSQEIDHTMVLAAAEQAGPAFARLVRAVIPGLAAAVGPSP